MIPPGMIARYGAPMVEAAPAPPAAKEEKKEEKKKVEDEWDYIKVPKPPKPQKKTDLPKFPLPAMNSYMPQKDAAPTNQPYVYKRAPGSKLREMGTSYTYVGEYHGDVRQLPCEPPVILSQSNGDAPPFATPSFAKPPPLGYVIGGTQWIGEENYYGGAQGYAPTMPAARTRPALQNSGPRDKDSPMALADKARSETSENPFASAYSGGYRGSDAGSDAA